MKALLLGTVIATLAASTFAGEALLSPRAAGNQIKVVPAVDTPAISASYVVAPAALLSPRAQTLQAKTVRGTVTDINPAEVCRRTMVGSPKAVTECSSHATMPACRALTAAK